MRQVEVLRTLNEVEAIADDWRTLEAATPEATGFQSYDWCRAWMRASGEGGDRWRIVVVRDGDRVASVWPLERERFLGARTLQWLGGPWTQYGDALVTDDALRIAHLAAAWREVTAWTDVDLIKLGRVREDAALCALPGFKGRTIVHTEHAPFLDLTETPPRSDKRLRARRRKLEALGPVRFDIVTEPVERRACARKAIAWKRTWLRDKGLASSGLFHANLEVLMEILANGSECDGVLPQGGETLVVSRLRVGERTVALELGLQANGAFRSLLGAHDAEFSFGSPGHLLINDTIVWCRTADFRLYDLMVPGDAYKRRWSNAETAVHDHLLTTRARGHLARIWYHARPAVKRIYAIFPDRWRRIIATGDFSR